MNDPDTIKPVEGQSPDKTEGLLRHARTAAVILAVGGLAFATFWSDLDQAVLVLAVTWAVAIPLFWGATLASWQRRKGKVAVYIILGVIAFLALLAAAVYLTT